MVDCVSWDLLWEGTEHFTFQHSLWCFDHSGTLLLFLKDWIKIWEMSVLLQPVWFLICAWPIWELALGLCWSEVGRIPHPPWFEWEDLACLAQEDVQHSTAAAPVVNYCSLEIINWCCQPHPGTRGAVLGFCAPALPVCAILCFLLLTDSSESFAGFHFPLWNCNRNLNYDFKHLVSFLLTGVLVVGNH